MSRTKPAPDGTPAVPGLAQAGFVASLRHRVRAACAEAGIPVEVRARLVLTVTLLAEPVLGTGGTVGLETVVADGVLTIGVRLPEPLPQRRLDDLPQCGRRDGRRTRHLAPDRR